MPVFQQMFPLPLASPKLRIREKGAPWRTCGLTSLPLPCGGTVSGVVLGQSSNPAYHPNASEEPARPVVECQTSPKKPIGSQLAALRLTKMH